MGADLKVIITAIQRQVKNAGRYSIFVDGAYAFSLSDLALLDAKLANGQELSKEQLEQLKQLSNEDKVQGNVLRFLAIRPRSEWEVRSYLQRKHSPAPLSDSILNKLSKKGLLNDLDFARVWVANRRLLRSTSKQKLQQELRAKRVSDEVITQALAEDETDEVAVLRDLITKKRKLTRYQDQQKLMQYLARQGFSYEAIKAALQEETQRG